MNVTIDRKLVVEAAAAARQRHQYVATVVPADATLDGAAILESMPVGRRALWWQPDLELLVVASGRALELRANAPASAGQAARFSSIHLAEAADRVGVVDPYGTGISPRLLGGFSFFADATWSGFGPGELILPDVAYVRDGTAAAWIVVQPASAAGDPLALIPDPASDRRIPAATDDRAVDLVEPQRQAGRELVARTIEEIEAGGLAKVVLARTATAAVRVDVPRLIATLVSRYPECATFAFERSGQWFAGASPELLIRKNGREVASAALAATAPRHSDPVLDRIELESLSTTKQLEEHRLVVEAVVEALAGAGVTTTVHDQEVMELRSVRHLATPIQGVAPESTTILELVGALHPTPAVGGVPGSGALDWIRANEGFVRGWYAAPVGVVDLDGDGEFRVALRSARITTDEVHFYAGAGIVAGSDADAEMAEIDLKLAVMAGAVAATG